MTERSETTQPVSWRPSGWDDNRLYDIFTKYIRYDLDKHGSYCGHRSIAAAVNSMSQHEFLQNLSHALDDALRPDAVDEPVDITSRRD